MAVKQDELQEIRAVLSAPDAEATAFSVLRSRMTHLRWLKCDASDVIETPLQSLGMFDVHLIDSSEHCVHVTDDMDRATGVLLAKRTRPA